MNRKILTVLIAISTFSLLDYKEINSEATNVSMAQQSLSPLIAYTTEKIGDREKIKITVTVKDRGGSGIKEFRNHKGNLISSDSYSFEIDRRGNYTFTAIDNNDLTSEITIDDSWINPIIGASKGRITRGSAYWSSSNLREWLNSDKETVQYTNNPPSSEFMGNNSYDEEPGFLSEFTQEEKDAILISKRRVFVTVFDKSIAEGGTINPHHLKTIKNSFLSQMYKYAFNNYNDFLYKTELDKVFLLSPQELYQYMIQRGFDIDKYLTKEAKNKNNINSNSSRWWLQYSSAWTDFDWGGIVNFKGEESLLGCAYPDYSSGIVPSIHLKPDYLVEGKKKASEFKIGETLLFGKYLNAPIEWRVINKTDDNSLLLISEKILDVKEMDSMGDQPRLYSDYVHYKEHDIDISENLQFKSTLEINDIEIPTLSILNESELNTRKNKGFTVDFKIDDAGSGVDYIKLPDGTKITDSTFSYHFSKNGDYTFEAMDNSGNSLVFYIPVYNINQEPEIDISISNSNWTNSDVFIDIKTTDKTIYRLESFIMDNVNNRNHGYILPNYTAYNDCNFKISGKIKLLDLPKNVPNPTIGFGSIFKSKKLQSFGYVSDMIYDRPLKININELPINTYVPFELIYTVPPRYSHELRAYFESDVGAINGKVFEIELKDVKFELAEDSMSDFRIEGIELPNGSLIEESFYSDQISAEGINTYTYKIIDSRGKETLKSVTTKIDKTSPELNIDYLSSPTNQDISIKLSALDNISGLKKIKLPNGNYINSHSTSYIISKDGKYTFECEDNAGNITRKTINVTNIDREKPTVSINKSNTDWTNKPIQININSRD